MPPAPPSFSSPETPQAPSSLSSFPHLFTSNATPLAKTMYQQLSLCFCGLRNLSQKTVPLLWMVACSFDSCLRDFTMVKYFTAYRIDHILGFFRIWELPEHSLTALVGKFRPSIHLSQEELEKEGIWNFDRLSCPYIRQEFLQEKFGSSWTIIAPLFPNECEKGHYEHQRPKRYNCQKFVSRALYPTLRIGDEMLQFCST